MQQLCRLCLATALGEHPNIYIYSRWQYLSRDATMISFNTRGMVVEVKATAASEVIALYIRHFLPPLYIPSSVCSTASSSRYSFTDF